MGAAACRTGWLGALVFLAVAAGVPAHAQYPERPIELIVPWGPGGGADQLARLVSKLAEPALGQGIPVVNVPGATGATGMVKLISAPADGYSMAIYIADSHALLAGKDARWTMNDIIPVAVMLQGPSFIFVAENSPFKTWPDFDKQARANPGKLKVATLGFGSVDDFSLGVLERKDQVVRCRSRSRRATCHPRRRMPCTSRRATSRSSSTTDRCGR
jgi:tripartite-type tricarboxylate transporter receptor subunit TctC